MNCALDWPDATTTLAGTVTFPFPLARPTVIGPVAAGPVRVRVHCAVPGALTVPGVQLRMLTCTVAATVTVAVWLCAPLVAVTVTIWAIATKFAVAVKVAVLEPVATVTLAGAVRAALLLDTPIVIALAAVLFRLTVQIVIAPVPIVFGEQLNALNCTGALRFSVKVCEAAFSVAVTMAL